MLLLTMSMLASSLAAPAGSSQQSSSNNSAPPPAVSCKKCRPPPFAKSEWDFSEWTSFEQYYYLKWSEEYAVASGLKPPASETELATNGSDRPASATARQCESQLGQASESQPAESSEATSSGNKMPSTTSSEPHHQGEQQWESSW